MEEIMLKGFSLTFCNMAVPGTAWNPLKITCSLTQEVTSAPFQETNLGAKVLALLAQPHSHPVCTGRTKLWESHHSQLGTTQLLCTSDALSYRSWQQQDKQARTAAAKKQGWPCRPQLPTSTERVNCLSSLPHHCNLALLPTAPTQQGTSWPSPHPVLPQLCSRTGPAEEAAIWSGQSVLWSVSCGHGSLYRLK